jgi:hypothetical protein
MILSTPEIFNETKAKAWQMGAFVSLVLAVSALSVSPEFSLMNLGLSMSAGLIALLTHLGLARRFPMGTFSLWVLVLVGIWLSPFASLQFESKRCIFAAGVLFLSFVFQGPVSIFFGILLAAFGICLRELVGEPTSLAELLRSDSILALLAGLGLGSAFVFARLSHTRSIDFLAGLRMAVSETEKARQRLGAMQDNVQMTRERLLGKTLADGESLLGELPAEGDGSTNVSTSVSFDLLIAELRQTFSEYQLKGRADGRVAGPIRFVFFAPVAGYDEKATIAVDLAALRSGVEACLTLALESLPEIGSRKREGVIRLSIRYGLRVVEIAVEDNGRGLTSRNQQAESDLGVLKDLVVNWGGKFDRLARLGVGSRTSLELRILRERTREFPASARGLREARAASTRVPLAVASSTAFSSGVRLAEDVPRA